MYPTVWVHLAAKCGEIGLSINIKKCRIYCKPILRAGWNGNLEKRTVFFFIFPFFLSKHDTIVKYFETLFVINT